jgi:hypothetical protein
MTVTYQLVGMRQAAIANPPPNGQERAPEGTRMQPHLAIAMLGLAACACSPTRVVTAPVQAAGQATTAVARAAAPVAAGAAVGVATANPAAGAAAGRAASGALQRAPADTAEAPDATETPR